MPFGLGKCVRSGVGFYRCECDRVRGFCIEEKGLKDWSVIGHGILAGKYLAEYRDSLK
jgi:hypothetical protein